MKMVFRWYGPGDSIPLTYIRQIPGMTGVVTAVYDVPVGEVWQTERILALRDGRVLTEGRPRDVLTSDTMRRLYGVEIEVYTLYYNITRVCTPASIARGE